MPNISTLFNLKGLALAAGISAIMASGITYKITSAFYQKELQRMELSMQAERAQARADYEKTLKLEIERANQLKEANDSMTLRLSEIARTLERKGYKDESEVISRANANRPRSGGVFVDPGKTTDTSSRNDSRSAEPAATQTTNSDSGRRLSDETVEFLLDLASSAEVLRRDCARQLEWSDAVEREYTKMIREYERIRPSNDPSSRR